MSNFAIETFTTKTNKVDLVDAAHINAVQTSIVNIETALNILVSTNGSLAQGTSFPLSPVNGQVFWRTDLNVVYVYNGSAWSPQSGITGYLAGDNLIAGPSALVDITGQTNYIKFIEIVVPRSGTLRIKFSLASTGGANIRGKIYRNGSAVGTEQSTTTNSYDISEDIAGWAAGDLLQLYFYGSAFSGTCCAGAVKVYELTPATEIFTLGGSMKFAGPMVYSGPDVPSTFTGGLTGLGSIGDFYINRGGGASTTLYVKTGASTWTAK